MTDTCIHWSFAGHVILNGLCFMSGGLYSNASYLDRLRVSLRVWLGHLGARVALYYYFARRVVAVTAGKVNSTGKNISAVEQGDPSVYDGQSPRSAHGFDTNRNNNLGQEDAVKRESKLERLKKSSGKIRHVCCVALKVIYVILAVIIILVAISLMLSSAAVAAGLAVTMTGQALRAAGLTVLTLTALLTAATAAAASHAVCVTKRRQLKISSIILAVTAAVAILVAVLVGLPSTAEQQALSDSLLESFRLASGPNPDSTHVKRWESTQSSLKCCGFNSPNDYKASAGARPDVPFPCCPSYDEFKTFPQQENERKFCNLKREYYKEGCESKVLQGLKAVGYAIISVTISLVVLQLVLVVLGVAVLAEKSHHDLEKNGNVLRTQPPDVENSNPSNN